MITGPREKHYILIYRKMPTGTGKTQVYDESYYVFDHMANRSNRAILRILADIDKGDSDKVCTVTCRGGTVANKY